MKVLMMITGFFAAIVLIAAVILLIIAIAKGKIKPRWNWGWVIVIILVFAGWRYGYYLTELKPTKMAAVVDEKKIPAWKEYDFSRVKMPGKVIVEFRPDARTEVTLPPCAVFRTRPSADIKIKFIDGSEYVDGPGKRVWFGLKKGIFQVRGFSKAGTLEIFLEEA